MNLLEVFVQTPAAAALGWTLAHSLWEGALVALALAVALSFLRTSRARYAAACLAMLGLIAIVALTFIRVMPARPPHLPMPGVGRIRPAAPLDPQSGDANSGARHAVEDYLAWLAPFWIAGVFLFHLRGLTSWMAARRLRRTGVCFAPDLWQAGLDRLRAQLRLSRPVALLESCLAEAPVVLGYLRPVILMPVGLLAGLPAGQIEAILLHELAHIRRYDYAVNLLQIFIEGLFFYHPAVWWISGVIRAERENCCDDLVVAVKGAAFEYATALAALEHSRVSPREALAATGGSLVHRIRRLLAQPQQPPSALTPVFTAALLTIIAVTVMAAWQSKPADPLVPPPVLQPPTPLLAQVKPAPEALPPPEKAPQESETPYQKWLTQDVVYIIEEDEKQAWKLLTTNEEREKFIEQFWLRRDPTRDTQENEFKQEHYRRIAYANERFGAARKPGWKTDRGRIYITYGPPNEIEDHGSGGTYQRPPAEGGGLISTYPFQQWRYHFIQGIGSNIIIEFVDPTGSHDYHMTTDPSEKQDKEHKETAAQTAALSHAWPAADAATASAGATVQVGNGYAMLSIPLDTYGNHQLWLYGRTFTKEGRLINAFDLPVKDQGETYTKSIPVQPGSYRSEVRVRDVTTGKLAADTIEFEVK
jgi:GWxTD domain-containing protein